MPILEGIPDVWLGVFCDYLSSLMHACGNIFFVLHADKSQHQRATLWWSLGFSAFFIGGLLDILALSLLSLSMWVCNGIFTLPLTQIFGMILFDDEYLRWWQWLGIVILCIAVGGTLIFGDHSGVDVTDKINYSIRQTYGIVYIVTILALQFISFVIVQLQMFERNYLPQWMFLLAGPFFSAIQASWSQLLIKYSYSLIKDFSDGAKLLHPSHLFFIVLIVSSLILQLCAVSWMFQSEDAQLKVVMPLYQSIVVLTTSFHGFFICDENPRNLGAFLAFALLVMIGLFISIFPEDACTGGQFRPHENDLKSLRGTAEESSNLTQSSSVGFMKDPGGFL